MQNTTFYEQLQNSKDLDLRDSRGKLHHLAFILLSLSLALLRRRDGLLSSIHRSMQNKNTELCNFLSIPIVKVVSRSHLPIVLSKVNLPVFEDLLFSTCGIELSQAERSWFAGDGKELRGSILKGNTRGEAVVSLVAHEQRDVLGQSFYSGNKESEKPCFQELLTKTEAAGQKITADALHLSPKTTEIIAEAGGVFV